MSSFALYVLGYALVIGGLAYGAYELGLSATWIGVGAAVLAGIGIASGAAKTRTKDQSEG